VVVQVTDSGFPALTASLNVSIEVSEVNSAPVVNNVRDRSVNEGTLLEISVSGSDPDIPSTPLTYTLAEPVPSGASIQASSGAFEWTAVEVDADQVFTFAVDVSDQGVPQATTRRTFRISVLNTSEAPVIIMPSGDLLYAENAGARAIDAATIVSDIDSPDFDGGRLDVRILDGAGEGDRLTFLPGPVSLIGASVLAEGLQIAEVEGGEIALTFDLKVAATPSNIQQLLRQLAFVNESEDPEGGNRTLQVRLLDGDRGESIPVEKEIIVVPVNDPPVAGPFPVATIGNLPVAVLRERITESFRDFEGDPFTIELLATESDQGGSLQVSATGRSIVYDPPVGFLGEDFATFTLRDTRGASSIGTFQITVQTAAEFTMPPLRIERVWPTTALTLRGETFPLTQYNVYSTNLVDSELLDLTVPSADSEMNFPVTLDGSVDREFFYLELVK
jgi:hypothetical protein